MIKKCIIRTLIVLVSVVLFVIVLAINFVYLYPGIGKVPSKELRAEYELRSSNFDGEQFYNENEDFVLLTGETDEVSSRKLPTSEVPVITSTHIDNAEENKLQVMWLGHSSILVQLGQKNILIDPVLTQYSSPVNFVGVKRYSDVAIEPKNLPQIDVLLLSHDHYDHLDFQTIMQIDSKVSHYIVPLGVESYLINWGINKSKITALAWWEEVEVYDVTYTLTPSQHYSGRNPLAGNTTLWGGYYFADDNHSVYYSGDSGYYDVFTRIGEKFLDVDLALIECGQYDNGWSMCHMFPEETLQAAKDVNAKWVIPVHWGAFSISNTSWDDSVTRVIAKQGEYEVNVATPIIGQMVDYDNIQDFQNHWWETLK